MAEEQVSNLSTPEVRVISPEGKYGVLPADKVEEYSGYGYRVESPDQYAARKQEEQEGALGQVKAFAEHAAGTATLGGTDVLLGAIGGDEYRRARALRDISYPATGTVADVAGMVIPALIPGGAEATVAKGAAEGVEAGEGLSLVGRAARGLKYSPAGLALQGGEIAAEGVGRGLEALGLEGTGLVSRATRTGLKMAAGGAVEGAAFGAGQALSEAALAPGGDYNEIGSKLWAGGIKGGEFGGMVGGGLGIGAEGLGAVARKIGGTFNLKRTIDEFADASALREIGYTKADIAKVKGLHGQDYIHDLAETVRNQEFASLEGIQDKATQIEAARKATGENLGLMRDKLDQMAGPMGDAGVAGKSGKAYRVITDQPVGVSIGHEPVGYDYDTFNIIGDDGGDNVFIKGNNMIFSKKVKLGDQYPEPDLNIWRKNHEESILEDAGEPTSPKAFRVITDEPVAVSVNHRPEGYNYDEFKIASDDGGGHSYVVDKDKMILSKEATLHPEPDLDVWRNPQEVEGGATADEFAPKKAYRVITDQPVGVSVGYKPRGEFDTFDIIADDGGTHAYITHDNKMILSKEEHLYPERDLEVIRKEHNSKLEEIAGPPEHVPPSPSDGIMPESGPAVRKIIDDLEGRVNTLKEEAIGPEKAAVRRLEGIIKDARKQFPEGASIDFSDAHKFRVKIDNLLDNYGSKNYPMATANRRLDVFEQNLKDFRHDLESEFERAAENIINKSSENNILSKDFIDAYRGAKLDYGTLKELTKISSKRAASSGVALSPVDTLLGGTGFLTMGPKGLLLAAASKVMRSSQGIHAVGEIAHALSRMDETIHASMQKYMAAGSVGRRVGDVVEGRAATRAVHKAIETAEEASKATTTSSLHVREAREERIRTYKEKSEAIDKEDKAPPGTLVSIPGAPKVEAAAERARRLSIKYLKDQRPAPSPMQANPFLARIARETPPDPSAVRKWLLQVKTVEDPTSVLESLQNGTLNSTQIHTLEATNMPYLTKIRQAAVAVMAEINKDLNFNTRIQLGVLTGADTDPSLRQASLAAGQAVYIKMKTTMGQNTPSVTPPMRAKNIVKMDSHVDDLENGPGGL
jgi:hypothetical protein